MNYIQNIILHLSAYSRNGTQTITQIAELHQVWTPPERLVNHVHLHVRIFAIS